MKLGLACTRVTSNIVTLFVYIYKTEISETDL